MNTYTTGMQLRGDVAVEADGDFVVVWADYNARDGSASALFGQRFDASGARLGGEFQVNSYTTGYQIYPSISMSPAGGFVVAWVSNPGDGNLSGVLARRFDSSGNPLGSDFVVNTYTTNNQRDARVAHDARGNFVVTWHSTVDGGSNETFAQRFGASGARRGAEFRVNTYATAQQTRPSVAVDAVGNFVVAWDSFGQDGSAGGIFAQRFGGLGPAALAVNSSGNQVLEPGETVDVRPPWRNSNGGALSFGGALTNINGPAGAIYTITDGAGDYGTRGRRRERALRRLLRRHRLQPDHRPALHWDASAVESILPDTQGQQKQWLLHVGGSFTDVPASSGFYRFVETLLHHGVTGGCSPTQYCPASSTTRDQMAVFVLVAKEGTGYVPPACTTPMFADVPASNPFCRWIEELARRAVVSGCGGGNYCPTASGHARADGGLRAAHARSRAQPAGLHDAHLQRRSREQRLLPLDRGADAARGGHRLRRRQLLPDARRHPRADGRVHQRDVRLDAVRPLIRSVDVRPARA